jgi:hypothetical protein
MASLCRATKGALASDADGRVRLRVELLEEESLREKFDNDLVEMQAMITQALVASAAMLTLEPQQLNTGAGTAGQSEAFIASSFPLTNCPSYRTPLALT